MGHCHGSGRFHWGDVSLLRGPAGGGSNHSGRCLRIGLSAAAGGALGRTDEVAGKDFRGAIDRRNEAGANEEAGRSTGMTGPELLNSLGALFGPKLLEKAEFRGETTYTIAAEDLR